MDSQVARYKIVAASPSKPGDLVIEDQGGRRHLFIGTAGSVSPGPLSDDLFETLVQRQHWQRQQDERWLSLDEIRSWFDPLKPDHRLFGRRLN